jgi:hypothetical protein
MMAVPVTNATGARTKGPSYPLHSLPDGTAFIPRIDNLKNGATKWD